MNDPLVPRKITFNVDKIPKYWAYGLVYPTHFFNAVSLSFPMMETMIIAIIKAAAKEIVDEELKEDMRLFCQQEYNHSAIHNSFNNMILGGSTMPEATKELANWCKKVNCRSIKERVCILISFEYFTASCARLLMRSFVLANKNGKLDDESFKVWYWHCAEEIEHHGVGWKLIKPFGITKMDLYKAVREYFFVFYPYLFSCSAELIKRDGMSFKSQTWLSGSAFLFRHFRRMVPCFVHFFSPYFGPHSHAELDKQLMEEFLTSGIEFK